MTHPLRFPAINTACWGASMTALMTMPVAAKPMVLPDGEQIAAIEEVVVTARRKPESLQEVPIAITAFQGERLEQMDLNNLSAFGDLTPNVTLKPTASLSGASNAAAFFIRGVGQTDFAVTTDPGVGTYLDGVYIARSVGGVLDTLDVESIEILRGPQGTLFGRNTIGGAVNIRTRRPSDEFSGKIRGNVGSRDRRDLAVSLDMPVNDQLKTRVSLLTQHQDGYVKRLLGQDDAGNFVPADSSDNTSTLSDRQGNRDSDILRFALAYQPTDHLEFYLTLNDTTIDEESSASTAALSSAGLVPSSALTPITLPSLGSVAPGDPRLITDDIDTTYATGPNGTQLDIRDIALTTTWDINDDLQLKSITAHRATQGSFNRDGDGTPFPIGEQTRDIDFSQLSQEIQLIGGTETVDWTLGLYYFQEESDDLVFVSLGNLFGQPPSIDIDNFVDNESVAAFGQATVHLSDAWRLTGGLRWTQDDKRYQTSQVISPIALTVVDGQADQTFDAVTGRLSTEYQWNQESLVYLSAARGFKSGGFTPRYVAPVATPTAFDEETVNSLELGWKWQGWNDRAQVNTALFTSQYEDIQLVLFDTFGAPINQNGGDATISGLEMDAIVVVNDYFRVTATAGYIDAGFDNVLPSTEASPAQPITVNSHFPNTPELQASLSPEVSFPFMSGRITTLVNWMYSDDTHQTFENDPELFQPAYSLVDALISYENKEHDWSVTLGSHNLTDKRVIISGGIGRVPGFGDVNYNRPREWYLTLQKGF